MSDAFATICILSYNRPQFIQDAIRSAREYAQYPLEIIVHDDGSDNQTQDMLHGMLQACEFSKLILNPPGQNQGVGEAVRASFNAASGKYLIKADQDLIFRPGWMSWAADLLDREPQVGMAGLFHYHVEPAPTRRMLKAQHHLWQEHEDFISSAFIIRRLQWQEYSDEWTTHSDAFAEDVLWKKHLQSKGFKLALPDEDYAVNRGFGVGPSTVALGAGPGQTQGIHHLPTVFGARDAEGDGGPTASAPIGTADVGDGATPDDFQVGVVITTCHGREHNLRMVLDHLDKQTRPVDCVVVVYDGCDSFDVGAHPYAIRHVKIPKHNPGQEQPRNVGVRHLQAASPQTNYVWFLDSDIIVGPDCLEEYHNAHVACGLEPHIILGPYEFLQPNEQGIRPDLRRDFRWISFNQYGVEHILRNELGSALACFGGNMVWPIRRFIEIGGFHPNLYHGRCEDGELGLRAASQGIGISFAAKARGYHQYHEVDYIAAKRKNERDVPLLNSMHPWVEGKGLIVTAQDGARFDFKCPRCEEQVNSLFYWEHMGLHGGEQYI